ncbi:23S rRNA pseudouridine1911/1915/1917 synthase [Ferrimonas sediminum]|uniref:23S rRNA pseudouridine1911/1915/1917 synthase n=1 Tax=Ferrimonas sediminum TaxID=718193 RepID=A0A1G8K5V2_9GAMM|nr:RluA family pseudouridine synthase [Ferrimonas sediminum]SDI38757.1 23S rRNA pseudouridine1911/1915/1917 synthase [Ferrimonas sediminum]
MTATFTDIVAPKDAGKPLYGFLRSLFPYLDAAVWQAFEAAASVEIDGELAEGNPALVAGQVLHYRITDYAEPDVDTQWQLLWEGTEIIAVHKPPSLPVSRTTRNIHNTLVQLVRRQSPWKQAHLLHRLDLDTGGIVLMAKDQRAASHWQPKLSELMPRKVYHAVVHGSPLWDSHELQCKLNTRPDSPIRCQMHVVSDHEKGKASHTRFRVLAREPGHALVECQLVTGRKHQIRAHLAHLGHAIVGDKIYANDGDYYLKRLADAVTDADRARLGARHHLLFARELEIKLAPDAPELVVTNPHYSDDWREFCRRHQLPLD